MSMPTLASRCTTHLAASLLQWSNAGVLLDTETTDLDGQIVEVAVTDLRGHILLDTLVRPTVPVAEAARAVHHITDADLAAAPTWPQIWPRLQWATRGRIVLAYNASFDREAIVRTCQAHKLDPGRLGAARTWWCLLQARTILQGHRSRLSGGHRALEDCRAAGNVLAQLCWGAPRALSGDREGWNDPAAGNVTAPPAMMPSCCADADDAQEGTP